MDGWMAFTFFVVDYEYEICFCGGDIGARPILARLEHD